MFFRLRLLLKIKFSGPIFDFSEYLKKLSTEPCKNGASCSVESKVDNFVYKCECLEQFIGETCDESPCLPDPCKNDGTCSINENRAGNFECDCQAGKALENKPCHYNSSKNI